MDAVDELFDNLKFEDPAPRRMRNVTLAQAAEEFSPDLLQDDRYIEEALDEKIGNYQDFGDHGRFKGFVIYNRRDELIACVYCKYGFFMDFEEYINTDF